MLLNIELFRFDPMNQLNFKVFKISIPYWIKSSMKSTKIGIPQVLMKSYSNLIKTHYALRT